MSFSVAKRVSTADRSLSNSARCASVKNSWFAYLAGRCRGVSNSSVQMPCRSGSPQDVFSAGTGVVTEAAGAWADVPVMDTEITAPTAVAAMATVIVKPEKRSSMMVSFRYALCYYTGSCVRRPQNPLAVSGAAHEDAAGPFPVANDVIYVADSDRGWPDQHRTADTAADRLWL